MKAEWATMHLSWSHRRIIIISVALKKLFRMVKVPPLQVAAGSARSHHLTPPRAATERTSSLSSRKISNKHDMKFRKHINRQCNAVSYPHYMFKLSTSGHNSYLQPKSPLINHMNNQSPLNVWSTNCQSDGT